MPEIRIGRIISRLSIPTIVLMPITSTAGELETVTEMKSERREITNKSNIPSTLSRPEVASACNAMFLVCEVCEFKYDCFFKYELLL